MVIILLASLLSGVAGGMGIGGGTILIPALTFLSFSQHAAQGLNLIFFIPTAITSIIVHLKNKNIEVKKAVILAISGAISSFLGSYLANITEGETLRKLFAVFLIIAGIYEIMKKEKKREYSNDF